MAKKQRVDEPQKEKSPDRLVETDTATSTLNICNENVLSFEETTTICQESPINLQTTANPVPCINPDSTNVKADISSDHVDTDGASGGLKESSTKIKSNVDDVSVNDRPSTVERDLLPHLQERRAAKLFLENTKFDT